MPADRPEPGYTPRYLQDTVLQQRSAVEGERKVLTVMFVDLQGSVEATGRIDSEEWHRVMDRFFSIAGDVIHRFDGTINQYTGDGVMALFGAPRALEDHAQCACDAALALQAALRPFAESIADELGISLRARVGLHSGEVVVATIGVDLRRDYTAQGHAVGIAARLESLAEANGICVSADTEALARDRFEFESLGWKQLKGILEPLEVFALRGARARSAARIQGDAAFIGREQELDLLESSLARVRAGRGRVIGLVGEAGVGKSRLVRELVERARREGFRSHAAHASGRRGAPAFEVIVELSRSLFGVATDDAPERCRERIQSRIEHLGPEFAELAPLACDFLGVADPAEPVRELAPAARRRQLAGLLRGLLDEAAASGPVLLVIEDAHWIDLSSLDVLPILVDHVAGKPMLLVFTARPGFSAPWMGSPDYQQTPLDPLPDDQCEGLVRQLVGPHPSTDELRLAIRSRAGGNPLFVEHSVMSLVASGVLEGEPGSYRLVSLPDRLELPPTVRALLSARIDRLAEDAKRVLHVAALVGGEFERDLVEGVVGLGDCESALDELHRLRLIEPRAGRKRYAFQHPLIREAAEQMQLRERKRELHGRIADALAARQAVGEFARMTEMAEHLERAGRIRDAARALQLHGSWIFRLDPRRALASFQKAQQLADEAPLDDAVAAMRVSCRVAVAGMGYQSVLGPAELARLKTEVESLCADVPHGRRWIARIYDYYGQSLLHDGRGRDGAEWLVRAQGLASEANDRELYFTLASSAAYLWRSVGDSRLARDATEEALAMRDALPTWGIRHHGNRAGIVLRHHRACALCDLGEVREGLSEMAAALRESLAAEEGQSRCWQVNDRVWLAEHVGGRDGLEEMTTAAVRWAEERGSDVVCAQMRMATAILQRWLGNFVEAAACFEDAISLSRQAHAAVHMLPSCFAALAECRAAVGDRVGACEALEEARIEAARVNAPPQDLRLAVARARCALRAAPLDAEAALAGIEDAERLALRLGLAIWRPSLSQLRAAWADSVANVEVRDEALARAAAQHRHFGDEKRALAVRATAIPVLPV